MKYPMFEETDVLGDVLLPPHMRFSTDTIHEEPDTDTKGDILAPPRMRYSAKTPHEESSPTEGISSDKTMAELTQLPEGVTADTSN